MTPYDDSSLSEFTGYFQAKEPERRERAAAWATAIGLQKVDGLTPSDFLLETAKAHIEGKITQTQARRRIRDYYAAKDENARPDPEKEEPDKVSERIVAVINERSFDFTPEYYVNLHRRLFAGCLPTAGKLRTVNILKHEWVLKEDSVTYGAKETLMSSLVRDFKDEREYDYGGKTPSEIIPHFVRFVARLWQVHPFMEGNTRTTAVFAIKYLRSLGFAAANDPFRENAWYFRNALVRANYADYARGVKREWGYLEAFFRNLLLGESNELKSRYLLIGLNREPPRFKVESGKKKAVRKSGKKTVERVRELIAANPRITFEAMVSTLQITRSTIQKHIDNLKKAGRLRRVGPDKGGHWEVLG